VTTLKTSLAFALAAFLVHTGFAAPSQTTDTALPTPTFHDVSYGPHKRNVLDFWQAKSDQPTPLLFYVHGGGWRGGDKSMVPPAIVKLMLEHHISVASVNYRYSQIARLPAPVHDAARALQFIRSKAAEWNIDKQHIAAMGASAGACTSLWIAYHDDLADPKSDDPVARESTRVCAAVGVSGQTSIDPKVVVPWVGDKIMDHGMMWASVGATNRAEAMRRYSEYEGLYHEFSPINHVTSDDPPVFLFYTTPTPLPATNAGIAIHHAMLGQKLKEKADAAGLVCELQYSEKAEEDEPPVGEFLLKHLTKP
jgi:arylformamidase